MSSGFDMALLFTLERCVLERNGQIGLHTTEKSLSTMYRSHRATRSTATKKALVTVPNEPPSLYQPACQLAHMMDTST